MSKENEKISQVAKIALSALKKVGIELGVDSTEVAPENIESQEEVKLETTTIQEGSVVIGADKWEAGEAVYIVDPETNERTPLPAGEYDTADLGKLVVEDDGIIASIGASEEEAPAEDAPVEEEMATVEEAPAKKVVESVTKETHFSAEQKSEIEAMFAKSQENLFERLVAEFKNQGEVIEQVEMSKEVPTTKHSVTKETKTNLDLSGMKPKDALYAILANSKTK
jgi:hypothetical protein